MSQSRDRRDFLRSLGATLTAGSALNHQKYEAYIDKIYSVQGLNVSKSIAVDQAYQRANGFGVAASAAGGLALGLGVAAAVVMPW